MNHAERRHDGQRSGRVVLQGRIEVVGVVLVMAVLTVEWKE